MGAVRVNADDAVRHVLTLLKQEQAARALQEADAALNSYPRSPELLHLKAFALRLLQRPEEAIQALRDALSITPNNHEMLNMLGNLQKNIGRRDEAEASYRKAIAARSDYTPAYKNLVTLLIDMRAIPAAIAAGEAYVQATSEKDADAFEALGRAYKANKAWHKASDVFRKAMALNPTHVAARFGEAACLVEIGEIRDAKALCDQLVREGQQAPQILRMLARAEMELTDFAAAEPHLQRAVASGSPEAVKDYANLLWMLGRESDADALLHGAVSAAVERPGQAVAGLDELLAMEKPQRVIALFDRLPAERKTNPDFVSRLSMAKGDLGETEEAFFLAEAAFKARPLNRIIAYQYIVASLMSGRYDLALAEVNNWRIREPSDQDWVALQADAHRMLGNEEAFRALYDYERYVIPAKLEVPNGYRSLEEFHADFIEQVHSSSVFRTHPLGQSARQGIQSPRNLVYDERPVVKNYIKALHDPVRAYVDQMGHDPANPMTSRNIGEFYIGGCWSIFLLAGGRHVSHTHPKGWVSSAYYMAVPPEAKEDTVNRPGWIKFGEPPYKLPDPAPAEHWVCPEPGTLVLFPAYMWHGTVPISGKAPRVTAPLDVLPGAAP